jgi:hypothetical protein
VRNSYKLSSMIATATTILLISSKFSSKLGRSNLQLRIIAQ